MSEPKEKQMVLFVFAALCSVLAVGFFAFFLYITPHILFDLHYDVPEFVIQLTVFLKDHRDVDGYLFISVVLLPFFVGNLIFAYIGRKLSDALQPKREDESESTELAAQVVEQQTTAGEETQQVTFSMKPTATEIVNEDGEVIGVENEKLELIGEPTKPELFETARHIEPIKYSRLETITLAAKLGILIAAIVLLIILADYLLVADMAHLIN